MTLASAVPAANRGVIAESDGKINGGWIDRADLGLLSSGVDNAIVRMDGVAGNIQSSTVFIGDGGAVTGVDTLSLSGQLTFAGAAATTKQASIISGTTTAAAWHRVTNTGADFFYGVESSAGGVAIAGSAAYSSFVATVGATALEFGTNGTSRIKISSAGAVTLYAPVSIPDTTASTSFGTGSLVVAGGLGVAGRINTTGMFRVVRTTNGDRWFELGDDGDSVDARIVASNTAAGGAFSFGPGTAALDTFIERSASGVIKLSAISGTAASLDVTSVGAAHSILVLRRGGSGQSSKIEFFDNTGTKYNWLAGAQNNVDNGFEITPSTATGGSTYTTPAISIAASTLVTSFGSSITVTNDATIGNGAGSRYLITNGANSGSAGGTALLLRNGGTDVLQLGNKSAILGGAYDSTPYISAPTTIQFGVGITTGSIASSSTVRVNGAAAIGALTVLTSDEAAPANVSQWNTTKHTLLAGPGNASTSTALACSVNTTAVEADIYSLTPGTAWRRLNVRCSEFSYHASGDGTASARFDGSVTAGTTRFLIYDVDNGALERVTVGAADSGGAGFKLLRIPN